MEGRWGGVGREEFEVQGVGGVEGDLGLAVVVEVFEEDFGEGVEFGCGVVGGGTGGGGGSGGVIALVAGGE